MFTDVLNENDKWKMQQFNSPNFTFFVVLLCFPNISKLLFGSRFLFDKFEAYLNMTLVWYWPSPTLVRSMQGAFDKNLRWEIGWSTVCVWRLLASHFLLWILASSIIFKQVQIWPKNEIDAYLKHDACMVLAKSNSSPEHGGIWQRAKMRNWVVDRMCLCHFVGWSFLVVNFSFFHNFQTGSNLT